jgi:hypothetical protein
MPTLRTVFRRVGTGGVGLACGLIPDGSRSVALLCRNRTHLLLLSSSGGLMMTLRTGSGASPGAA